MAEWQLTRVFSFKILLVGKLGSTSGLDCKLKKRLFVLNLKIKSPYRILIALYTVDYQLFLKSEKIEEKMLAILGNLNNKSPGLILKQILLDINGKAVEELSADRHVKQLHVLVVLESSGLVLANVAFKRCKDAK